MPNVLLAAAATTRAFIFWLEAMAQIACLMIASQVLSGDVVCFVDNCASEHAVVGSQQESRRPVCAGHQSGQLL